MPHYYSEKQEGELKPVKIAVSARGQRLSMWSGSGVFSKAELDDGTKLLIDTCELKAGWRVHDLGCGYGVVGIIVKRAEPSCSVVCSDVSERAVELTKLNVKSLKLDIRVVQSDGYATAELTSAQFDTVLFNPPYVAGRETIYRLLDEVYEHLVPGGSIQLVARHNKGGETLKKRLIELFGNCDDSRRARGYRVYVSKRDE
jgi:16S rRNA G1207 methylase RsmC